MYDRTTESEGRRKQRIRMIKESQSRKSGLTHNDIDDQFEDEDRAIEEKEMLRKKEELRQIAETEQKSIEQEAINSKKYELLQKIDESVTELSKHEDSDILASYLKQKVFDPITNQTDECQIVLIMNWKNGNITYHVQANPNVIPFNQISEVKIIAKEGFKLPKLTQKSASQGTPEFEAIEKAMKEGKIN